MPNKTTTDSDSPSAPRAIRWIPDSPGVYPGRNLTKPTEPLVFAHGTVVGVDEPLGEGAPSVSAEFAQSLIEAGHAEATRHQHHDQPKQHDSAKPDDEAVETAKAQGRAGKSDAELAKTADHHKEPSDATE